MWFVLMDEHEKRLGEVYVDSHSFKRNYYEDFLAQLEHLYMSALREKERRLGQEEEERRRIVRTLEGREEDNDGYSSEKSVGLGS